MSAPTCAAGPIASQVPGSSQGSPSGTLDLAAGNRRGPRSPTTGSSWAALASSLNVDTATVKAAFAKIEAARKADHAAREAAHAALAAQLNVSTAAVKNAFEANRPAKPTW